MLLTINSSVSSSLLTKSPSIPITTYIFPNSNPATGVRTPRWTPQALQFRVSSSANQTVEVASPPENVGVADCAAESGADIVRKFYGGINGQDLASVEELIAEKCVYEDLVFPRPFVGRKDILQFFKKFNDSVGKDLQFVIDDISTEDSTAVGVTWHLEWNGKPFPFSKGCSFYRLEVVNGKRQIPDYIRAMGEIVSSLLSSLGILCWLPSEVWLGFFDSSLSWLTSFKVVFSTQFFLSYRDIYIIYSGLV